MYVHMYVRMYVCMHACMYVCMHVCMYVRTNLRTYLCMQACVNVCVCAYLHGVLWLPFAKFVNLMLEDAFNFETVEYSLKILNLNWTSSPDRCFRDSEPSNCWLSRPLDLCLKLVNINVIDNVSSSINKRIWNSDTEVHFASGIEEAVLAYSSHDLLVTFYSASQDAPEL